MHLSRIVHIYFCMWLFKHWICEAEARRIQGFTPSTPRFVCVRSWKPGWNVMVYRSTFLGFPQRDYHPTCNCGTRSISARSTCTRLWIIVVGGGGRVHGGPAICGTCSNLNHTVTISSLAFAACCNVWYGAFTTFGRAIKIHIHIVFCR